MPGLPIDIDRNRMDGYGFALSFDCGVFMRLLLIVFLVA
jgi:hypothetical protein